MSVSFIEPSHEDLSHDAGKNLSKETATRLVVPKLLMPGKMIYWWNSWKYVPWKWWEKSLHVTARMYLLDTKIIVYMYHSPTGSTHIISLNQAVGSHHRTWSQTSSRTRSDSQKNDSSCLFFTGWWFQPHLKNINQIGSFPQVGVKIKIIIETTT